MMNDNITTTTTTTTTTTIDNSHNNNTGCWIGIDIGTSNSSVAVYDRTRGSSKWIRLSKSIAICNNDTSTEKLGRIVPTIIVLATERYILDNTTTNKNNPQQNLDSKFQNNTSTISPTTATTTTTTTTTTSTIGTSSLTTEWYDVSHLIKRRMILTTTTKTTTTTSTETTDTDTNTTIFPFDDSNNSINNNKLYACIGSAAIQLANFYSTTTTKPQSTVDNTISIASTNTKQQQSTVVSTTVTTTVNDIEAATIRNFKRKIFLQNSETYNTYDNDTNGTTNSNSTDTNQYYPLLSDIFVVPLGMKQQCKNNDTSAAATTTTTTASIVLLPIDAITILLYILRVGSNEYLYNNIHKKHLQIPGQYPPCINVTIGVPIKSSPINSNKNTIQHNKNNNNANKNNKQNQQYRYLLINCIGPLSGFTGTIHTLSESTAAAMSYGLFTKLSTSTNTTTATTRQQQQSSSSSSLKSIQQQQEQQQQQQQEQQQQQPRLILVFDMGGGTTDVTIIQQQQEQQAQQQQQDEDDDNDIVINNDMKSDYTVVATSGNNQLGGIDIDTALSTIVCDKIHNHCRKDSNDNEQERTNYQILSSPSMILELCKNAKEQLCCSNSSSGTKSEVCTVNDVNVTVNVQFIDNTTTNIQKYEKSITITITQNEFLTAIQPIVQKAEVVVRDAISSLQQRQQRLEHKQPLVDDDNNVSNDSRMVVNTTTPSPTTNQIISINEVVLVGGSSRVPAIRNMLRSFHNQQQPQLIDNSTQKEVVVEEEEKNDSMKQIEIQQQHQEQQFVFENELCLTINPMSAVAQGCAVHAAIVSKTIPYHELQSAMMLDTCPYPIGVLVVSDNVEELENDFKNDDIILSRKQSNDPTESKFIEIISKDSTLPASNFETFQLANIHQKGVTINAVEMISDDWNGRSRTDEQQQQQQEAQYNKLGEFTFLLHKLNSKQIQKAVVDGYRSIDVGMTLTQHGQFIVSIFDHNDPDHIIKLQSVMEDSSNITNVRIKKRLEEHYNKIRTTSSDSNGPTSTGSVSHLLSVSENDATITAEQLLLLFACIGTFILYIFVKIILSEDVNINRYDSTELLQNDYITNEVVVDTKTMETEL